jgi:hypothetical protein
LNKSKLNGILAWPSSEPITQMTHPSMFKYFKAAISDFYFVHMLDTRQLILYNNRDIHTKLMLPLVKCALKESCVAPLGSKYHGCDFSRRPTFLYSSCHRYEMSAFSIIAAMMFDFDESKYTMSTAKNTSSGGGASYLSASSPGSINNESGFIQLYYDSFMTAMTPSKANELMEQNDLQNKKLT